MKVLIVDDHTVVRHGVQEILTRTFGKVTLGEASDSSEAGALLTRESWDLMVLDINMPGRSGLDVLEESRRFHPKMPVLVLSAYPEEEFAKRAFQLGASGYLNKQSAFSELVSAVKKILGGGKYVTASLAEKLANSIDRSLQQAPHEVLSNRELQVLRMVAVGKTLKEIASELSLSEKTIGTYRARISEKMGMGNGVELARYALQHKLVE